MVIDDDAAFRAFCSEYLQDEGYYVTTAKDGPAAEHAVASIAPDLVILDVHLASVSGFAFLNYLRNDPRTLCVPVIMTSADRHALAPGTADLDQSLVFHITKPFDLIDMGDLIVRALAQARVRRSLARPARLSA